MASAIIGLEANHLRLPGMVGGAGVVGIINGALILITPAVGRVTGNLSGLAAAKIVSKDLTNMQAENTRNFALHKREFISALNNVSDSTPYLNRAKHRQKVYDNGEQSSISMQQFLLNQRQKAKGTLRENIVFASIVGPPRVNSGIAAILGAWKYHNNRITASKLFAASTTANCAAAGFAMFETARVEISAELYAHKMAKSNLLPKQQFEQRIQALTQMENDLK